MIPLFNFRCPEPLASKVSNEPNKSQVMIAALRLYYELNIKSLPMMDYDRLPEVAAIYFVTNSQGRILYIGQTENIFFEWQAHKMFNQLVREDHRSNIIWCEFDPNDSETEPIVEDNIGFTLPRKTRKPKTAMNKNDRERLNNLELKLEQVTEKMEAITE